MNQRENKKETYSQTVARLDERLKLLQEVQILDIQRRLCALEEQISKTVTEAWKQYTHIAVAEERQATNRQSKGDIERRVTALEKNMSRASRIAISSLIGVILGLIGLITMMMTSGG